MVMEQAYTRWKKLRIGLFLGEVAHEAVSRRPPISLYTIVARTRMYTYDAKVWDASIVQGPFSVAPCQTLIRCRLRLGIRGSIPRDLFHRCRLRLGIRGSIPRFIAEYWNSNHASLEPCVTLGWRVRSLGSKQMVSSNCMVVTALCARSTSAIAVGVKSPGQHSL